ncbi:MAG: alpha/beta fold hydrolase [Nocardiaceae bacterium]|nr:alpha/beta fold hydrolase [Nocardiaceae bacterium]
MISQLQIVVGDVRTPVLVGGPAEADPAEAVVFVHGNPGSGADWRPLIDAVAPYARVIAPDMPGFGGAEMRADMRYTVADYAAHLNGVLDALGVRRVHLVAHDFGGPWALTWAAAHPDRVASVSLLNTGVLLDYRWHRVARVWRTPVIGELLQLLASNSTVEAILSHDSPNLDRRWIRHLARLARPWGTRRAILRLYRSTTQNMMDRLVPSLRAADLPCQVIWGTGDAYLPTEQAHRQLEPFPSATLHLVDGAGHWVWLEQPDLVASRLVAFLKKHLNTNATV